MIDLYLGGFFQIQTVKQMTGERQTVMWWHLISRLFRVYSYFSFSSGFSPTCSISVRGAENVELLLFSLRKFILQNCDGKYDSVVKWSKIRPLFLNVFNFFSTRVRSYRFRTCISRIDVRWSIRFHSFHTCCPGPSSSTVGTVLILRPLGIKQFLRHVFKKLRWEVWLASFLCYLYIQVSVARLSDDVIDNWR